MVELWLVCPLNLFSFQHPKFYGRSPACAKACLAPRSLALRSSSQVASRLRRLAPASGACACACLPPPLRELVGVGVANAAGSRFAATQARLRGLASPLFYTFAAGYNDKMI